VGRNVLLYKNYPVIGLLPFKYMAVNGWMDSMDPGKTSTFIIPGYFYEPCKMLLTRSLIKFWLK
jgi:hypothetical protein